MAFGILLSQFFPSVFHSLGKMEIAEVNIPVGILILVMIIPIMLKYSLCRATQERHCVAGPAALIGASNFMEDDK